MLFVRAVDRTGVEGSGKRVLALFGSCLDLSAVLSAAPNVNMLVELAALVESLVLAFSGSFVV